MGTRCIPGISKHLVGLRLFIVGLGFEGAIYVHRLQKEGQGTEVSPRSKGEQQGILGPFNRAVSSVATAAPLDRYWSIDLLYNCPVPHE